MTTTFPQKVPCASSYYSADRCLANAPGPGGLGLFPWAKVKLSVISCQGPHAFSNCTVRGQDAPALGQELRALLGSLGLGAGLGPACGPCGDDLGPHVHSVRMVHQYFA